MDFYNFCTSRNGKKYSTIYLFLNRYSEKNTAASYPEPLLILIDKKASFINGVDLMLLKYSCVIPILRNLINYIINLQCIIGRAYVLWTIRNKQLFVSLVNWAYNKNIYTECEVG